ncbi:MAG: thioredoxin domain-containing protein [bacterium]|nr:thioredoxin domain-containing protein [bacterium]
MKRISILIVTTFCVTVALSAPPAFAEVAWSEDSFETILEKARAENKHVLIDFYTTWCGPCKKMDKETYTALGVQEFLGEMIAVKIDCEKGEGIEVAEKFRVHVYPSTALLGPDGEEIDRVVGFLDADDFVTVMNNYKNGIETVAYYEKKVKENPQDADLWKILGIKHADAGRSAEAIGALQTYLELNPNAKTGEKAEVNYTVALAQYEAGEYKDAVGTYTDLAKNNPDSEWYDRSLTGAARAYYKLGQEKKCIESYMKYVDRHPDDPGALNSFAWFCASKRVGLDAALPVALKAAELSDRSPGILDTLAELYYARGEYDKAIKIGKEALSAEPEDQYFKDQIEKFQTAKIEAEKRAGK